MHIGQKIKFYRSLKNWTQRQLAEKINKSRPMVSYIEQNGNVHQDTLNDILKALNISLKELENPLEEPTANPYLKTDDDLKSLLFENESLKKEVEHLKTLVQTQKEYIELLKKQNP